MVKANEIKQRTTEFATLAKFVLANRGMSNAAAQAEVSSRKDNLGPRLASIIKHGTARAGVSREILSNQKSAVVAGGLTASPLADYSNISAGFINSLVNASAFDTMLASMVPVPLGTGTVGAVPVGAQAYSLGEGSAKPISPLSISNQAMTPQKSHCVVVVTEELARTPLVGGTALIENALRSAVAVITDAQFIATITAGLSAVTSVGSTPDAVRQTISTLLSQITTNQNSRLFLLTTPAICKTWCMLSSGGINSFPGLGPLGGVVSSIPVIASDGVLSGQVILVDASGIAAAPGEVALQDFHEGALVADSAPDSPTLPSTVVTSLWQSNLAAIVVERFFCCVKVRSDAVAFASGVSNSPA
jgi:hypothetical protein